MTSKTKNTVLILGNLNPRAVEGIEANFPTCRLARPEPGDVTAAMAREVVALAGMAPNVGAGLMDALPYLQIVASMGVGYDGIDASHAVGRGIMVTNTPDVLSEEVADTTIGLLINTLRELPRAERWLREGRWSKEGDYRLTPMSLRDRSVGIFGLGRIGMAVARRLEGFDVPISYHNRRPVDDVPYRYHATLRELAEAVDTLISVVPGGPATERAVDAEILGALGPDGVFINIGRGSTVDEEALIAALSDGTIRAAGLDVFAREPHVPEALLKLENASLLPHVGSASRHTRNAMADLVVDNLKSWFGEGRALTPVTETRDVVRPR